MTARWEHFRHGSDIGVRGHGPTLAGAFEQVGLALTAVITDPAGVRQSQPVTIECRSDDPEYLLVDWLNSLIYEMATRHMLFGGYQVRLDGDRLSATVWGELVEQSRHCPAVEVKGATLSELRVARDAMGQWLAQCVVDV